jgi:glycerol-3-phosphate acyltransferase PlsY
MLYLCFAFAVTVPYLICSINPAIIVTKIKSGKDIRDLGSGNAGLTNVLRTQGKGAALAVLLIDVFKGVVSVLAVQVFAEVLYRRPLFENTMFIDEFGNHLSVTPVAYPTVLFMWIAAVTAVLGHCFPIYYKFKGGKAVLVTISALFVIEWRVAIFLLSLFIIITALTRYVSLGSVIGAAAYPFAIMFYEGWIGRQIYVGVPFAAIIAAILIFMHRGNIKRLIAGNEKKLGKKEK